jgi:hypothetical protein
LCCGLLLLQNLLRWLLLWCLISGLLLLLRGDRR